MKLTSNDVHVREAVKHGSVHKKMKSTHVGPINSVYHVYQVYLIHSVHVNTCNMRKKIQHKYRYSGNPAV